MKLYTKLASLVSAYQSCKAKPETHGDWMREHARRIQEYSNRYLPSGSGVDAGAEVNPDTSTPDRLVIVTSFRHMDENGSYDGWTDHGVIVTPSLAFGFVVKVSGRDRNDVKNYLGDIFSEALDTEVDERLEHVSVAK